MPEDLTIPVVSDNFTHLHLHSVYSLLDGAIRIKDLIQEVKALGMKSVAVTDHGNMFGAIEFYEEARKHNIKPIIGCEFYIAPGSRHEKKMAEKIADGQAYHLVLLAKNKKGYANLIKLASKAYTEGFYRKPRIDYELLSQHTEGVVGLTACLAGEVNRRLYNGQHEEAYTLAGHLNELFGQGNFYLEVQNHGIQEQIDVTKGAIALNKRTGIPLVLTNDSHFLRKEDQKAQDIMLRIQMNKHIDDPMEFGFNNQFYVKSPNEMKLLYPELMDAFHNTQRIDEMIDLQLDFGHPLLPNFKTANNESLEDYLSKLAYKGLRSKFESDVPKLYLERLQYELDVIRKMTFEGYFLIVADFIDFAKRSNIPVGPGRGSAAGSLVAYSLGITAIDPLKYNLLFERFLNPSRNEMPDVDIDFCRDRREEVINYVIQKYGSDKVAQIITFGTLSAKAVIKDVARVLGYNFAEINAISKNLPDTPGISLDEAIKEAPEAKDFFESGEKEKLLWQVAKTLEGMPRNSGKHAAGVVIAPAPLDEIVPLAKDTKTNSIITQFEKNTLEKIGLVKMDFLGLKNLTIIYNAIQEIRSRHNNNFDIEKIPLDDNKTYELLQKGLTKGIFQVESSGITNLIQKAKPSKFEDIVACIALYRPGPLQSGMADEYIKCKNGETKVTYPHESLKNILEDTFGTIVYQEQVMLISQIAAGFTMSEADTLRKAMGKKKMDVMAQLKEKFVEGAITKGHEQAWADDLFEKMSKFGEYGFNKSHSVAYGLITYQTAYLKANYPVEFLKSTLDADIENSEKLIELIHSSQELNITILPPDINQSNSYFTILSDNIIRYGLLGLKGIGKIAIEEIINSKSKAGTFNSISDLASQVPSQYFTKKILEALIYSGSLDSLGYNRASLYNSLDDILNSASKLQLDKASGQDFLFGGGDDEDGKDSLIFIKEIEDWSSEAKLRFEKDILGLYLTDHPVAKYHKLINKTKITDLNSIDDGISKDRTLNIVGVIEQIKSTVTKRGTFYSLLVSDLTGRADMRVYTKLYEKYKNIIIEGNILIFDCKAVFYREGDTETHFISVNQIHTIDESGSFIDKALHINLCDFNNDILIHKIKDIKKILKEHTGTAEVFFHFKNGNNEVKIDKLHSSFFVEKNTLLNEKLKAVLLSDKKWIWKVGNE